MFFSNTTKAASEQKNKILQLENSLASKEKDLAEYSRKLTEATKEQEILGTESQKSQAKIADLTVELSKEKTNKNEETAKLEEEIAEMKIKSDKVSEELARKCSELENLQQFKTENLEKIEKINDYEREAAEVRNKVESMELIVEKAEAEKSNEMQKAQEAIADKVTCEMKQWELEEKISALEKEKGEAADHWKQVEEDKSSLEANILSLDHNFL